MHKLVPPMSVLSAVIHNVQQHKLTLIFVLVLCCIVTGRAVAQ
jgi:hypothetical protein